MKTLQQYTAHIIELRKNEMVDAITCGFPASVHTETAQNLLQSLNEQLMSQLVPTLPLLHYFGFHTSQDQLNRAGSLFDSHKPVDRTAGKAISAPFFININC